MDESKEMKARKKVRKRKGRKKERKDTNTKILKFKMAAVAGSARQV